MIINYPFVLTLAADQAGRPPTTVHGKKARARSRSTIEQKVLRLTAQTDAAADPSNGLSR